MTPRIFLQAVAVGIVLLLGSCAKDKAAKPSDVDCTTVSQAANTYSLRVKTILNNSCTAVGCHDALLASAGINLATYDGSKVAFESNDVLCTVKHGQGCLPMPQGAPKLADSLITYLQCWAENNYPQ